MENVVFGSDAADMVMPDIMVIHDFCNFKSGYNAPQLEYLRNMKDYHMLLNATEFRKFDTYEIPLRFKYLQHANFNTNAVNKELSENFHRQLINISEFVSGDEDDFDFSLIDTEHVRDKTVLETYFRDTNKNKTNNQIIREAVMQYHQEHHTHPLVDVKSLISNLSEHITKIQNAVRESANRQAAFLAGNSPLKANLNVVRRDAFVVGMPNNMQASDYFSRCYLGNQANTDNVLLKTYRCQPVDFSGIKNLEVFRNSYADIGVFNNNRFSATWDFNFEVRQELYNRLNARTGIDSNFTLYSSNLFEKYGFPVTVGAHIKEYATTDEKVQALYAFEEEVYLQGRGNPPMRIFVFPLEEELPQGSKELDKFDYIIDNDAPEWKATEEQREPPRRMRLVDFLRHVCKISPQIARYTATFAKLTAYLT
jgi:hypothetical protein